MYVVCVSVHVKAEFIDSFIAATLDNARHTRSEAGNLRFDILRREDLPSRFLLYEAYRDRSGFTRHQETGHYLRWREAVKDWMAEPRVGLKHTALFFGDEEVGAPAQP